MDRQMWNVVHSWRGLWINEGNERLSIIDRSKQSWDCCGAMCEGMEHESRWPDAHSNWESSNHNRDFKLIFSINVLYVRKDHQDRKAYEGSSERLHSTKLYPFQGRFLHRKALNTLDVPPRKLYGWRVFLNGSICQGKREVWFSAP